MRSTTCLALLIPTLSMAWTLDAEWIPNSATTLSVRARNDGWRPAKGRVELVYWARDSASPGRDVIPRFEWGNLSGGRPAILPAQNGYRPLVWDLGWLRLSGDGEIQLRVALAARDGTAWDPSLDWSSPEADQVNTRLELRLDGQTVAGERAPVISNAPRSALASSSVDPGQLPDQPINCQRQAPLVVPIKKKPSERWEERKNTCQKPSTTSEDGCFKPNQTQEDNKDGDFDDPDPRKNPPRNCSRPIPGHKNRPPVFISLPNTELTAGMDWSYLIKATDPDGDRLRLSLVEGPDGMSLDACKGVLRWRIGMFFEGKVTVRLRVVDIWGAEAFQTFVLHLDRQNRPPEIVSRFPTTPLRCGREMTWEMRAVDPDGDALRWSLVQAPAGMIVDPATGWIRWTPPDTGMSSAAVQVLVEDGRGGKDRQCFVLKVTSCESSLNHGPEFVSKPLDTVRETQTYSYQAKAVDPDGDLVSYQLLQGPGGMSATTTGLVTYNPSYEAAGTYQIRIEASDPKGSKAVQVFQLVVLDLNRAPVFLSVPDTQGVGSTWTYNARLADPDGDRPVLRLQQGPTGMFVDSVSWLVRWNPSSQQAGLNKVTLIADDHKGGTATQQFVLRVPEGNSPPLVDPVPDTTQPVGIELRVTLTARDPNGDPVTFKLEEGPAGLRLVGNVLVWTPALDQEGSHFIRVLVEDGKGGATEVVFAVIAYYNWD